MRVPCNLKAIRGEVSLREIEDRSGVGKGTLSRIENGHEFPLDKHVPLLEEAYGVPSHLWWPPAVLILIERDRAEVD